MTSYNIISRYKVVIIFQHLHWIFRQARVGAARKAWGDCLGRLSLWCASGEMAAHLHGGCAWIWGEWGGTERELKGATIAGAWERGPTRPLKKFATDLALRGGCAWVWVGRLEGRKELEGMHKARQAHRHAEAHKGSSVGLVYSACFSGN